MNNNGNLKFDIYRKPTFTGRLITSDSFQNYNHKMAALHSMAHRMISIPLSSERYEIEKDRIIEIGRINGYSSTVINIIKKHELKKQLSDSSTLFSPTKKDETNGIVLPYLHQSTSRLARIYHDNGYQAVNTNNYSLQKLIGNAKDKIPNLLKSGIYEIECQDDVPYLLWKNRTKSNDSI